MFIQAPLSGIICDELCIPLLYQVSYGICISNIGKKFGCAL